MSAERIAWEYVDDQGRIQGPFSALKMCEWLQKGLLASNVRAKRVCEDKFIPICFRPQGFSFFVLEDGPDSSSPSAGTSWMYKDDSGLERGPATSATMREWYQHGFLDQSSMVRKVEAPTYEPIGSLGAGLFGVDPSSGWRYCDPSGVVYGEFTTENMKSWYKQQFFEESTPVCSPGASEFVVLGPPGSEPLKLLFPPNGIVELPAPIPESTAGKVDSTMRSNDLNGDNEAVAGGSSAAAGKGEVEPEEEWMYIDLQGETQGPFDTASIQEWTAAGFFLPSTQVWRLDMSKSSSIELSASPFAPFLPSRSHVEASSASMEVEPSPVAPSSSSTSTSSVEWMYIDLEGSEQGPFDDTSMKEWVSHGYFKRDTMVKVKGTSQYVQLSRSDLASHLPASAATAEQQDAVAPERSDLIPSGNGDDDASTKPSQEGVDDCEEPKEEEETKEEEMKEAAQNEDPSPVEGASNEPDRHWMYRDLEDVEQGPHSEVDMSAWVEAGYFKRGTKVKQSGEDDYILIEDSLLKRHLPALEEEEEEEKSNGEGEAASSDMQEEKAKDSHENGPETPVSDGDGQADAKEEPSDAVSGENEEGKCEESEKAKSPPSTPASSSTSNLTAKEEPESSPSHWFYLDKEKQPKGPFSTEQMASWASKGLLPASLQVRGATEESYYNLGTSILRIHLPGASTTGKSGESTNGSESKASPIVTGIEAEKWFYLDASGKEQGPFSHTQMKGWFASGLIKADLRVRLEREKQFTPIHKRSCTFVTVPPAVLRTQVAPQATLARNQRQPTFHPHRPSQTPSPRPPAFQHVPHGHPGGPAPSGVYGAPPAQHFQQQQQQHNRPVHRQMKQEPRWFYIGSNGMFESMCAFLL